MKKLMENIKFYKKMGFYKYIKQIKEDLHD
jgi:hypothetical protein